MAAFTICSDFGAPKNKVCHSFHCFPIYFPWRDGIPGAMIFIFWVLSFKPIFSLSSFTFKSLFSSSSLSTIKVVSSVYLRLLIFLPAVLIPLVSISLKKFSVLKGGSASFGFGTWLSYLVERPDIVSSALDVPSLDGLDSSLLSALCVPNSIIWWLWNIPEHFCAHL